MPARTQYNRTPTALSKGGRGRGGPGTPRAPRCHRARRAVACSLLAILLAAHANSCATRNALCTCGLEVLLLTGLSQLESWRTHQNWLSCCLPAGRGTLISCLRHTASCLCNCAGGYKVSTVNVAFIADKSDQLEEHTQDL